MMMMMMRKSLKLLAAVALVWMAGCGYRAPVVAPLAAGFNNTAVPMNLRFRSTPLGSKQGKASAVQVLGLVSFGDATIGTAARNGNINTVYHADSELTNILGLYVKHTTIVYGD